MKIARFLSNYANPIDIICLLVMLYGFYVGYSRGIIGTATSIIGYALGIILSYKAIPLTKTMLETITGQNHPMMAVGAFVVNIIIVFFILRAVSGSLVALLTAVRLDLANKMLGAIFMSLFSALIFSVLLWFAVQARFVSQEILSGSRTYEGFLEEMPRRARRAIIWMKPFLTEAWDDSMDWMNKLEDYGQERAADPTQPRIYELPDVEGDIESDPDASTRRPRQRVEEEGDGIEE